MFEKVDWKDLLWRAFHTFYQAFIVAFAFPAGFADWSAWEAAIVAAAGAGLSAVKTFIVAQLS